MDLSYVIVTHNRRDTLLRTLAVLERVTPLARDQWEVWVVDNASTDGTSAAVTRDFPQARLISCTENLGVGARSRAFGRCTGRHVVLLDDDSYPAAPETIRGSMDYLDAHPRVGAVVGRVLLPDGRAEACALPAVLISCAVMVRGTALREVGTFREEFFRKAGEYDFSFRLLAAGWAVERFENLVYCHDKHLGGRSAAFGFRMDVRNNLLLVERFLPPAMRRVYRKDYLQRYAAFARHEGHEAALSQAIAEARVWAARERTAGRQTLPKRTLEAVYGWKSQAAAVSSWARRHRVRRVVIADHAKNLYATFRAARRCGLEVAAIAENHPALVGADYRGVPVRPDQAAFVRRCDAVILANVNPAQVESRVSDLRRQGAGPLLALWEPRLCRLPCTSLVGG